MKYKNFAKFETSSKIGPLKFEYYSKTRLGLTDHAAHTNCHNDYLQNRHRNCNHRQQKSLALDVFDVFVYDAVHNLLNRKCDQTYSLYR